MNRYFNLFSCCILVKGYNRSTVCDTQRDNFYLIPNILYEILTERIHMNINEIIEYYGKENSDCINEYFDYLLSNELGFYSIENISVKFPEIDQKSYYLPTKINNAIIDIDNFQVIIDEKIISQLSELRCEAVELRFFSSINISDLFNFLVVFDNTNIRSIEVLCPYNDTYKDIKEIIQYRLKFARLKRLTLYGSNKNGIYENIEFTILKTKEIIVSESSCGKVCMDNFNSKIEFFIESKNYNNCLNKKVSIDKFGNIKNCPSMSESFGHINDSKLSKIIEKTEFKKFWNINKDQIEVCRDCEFRYICMDCRAYRKSIDNEFSKPLKCNYDPYQNIWHDS